MKFKNLHKINNNSKDLFVIWNSSFKLYDSIYSLIAWNYYFKAEMSSLLMLIMTVVYHKNWSTLHKNSWNFDIFLTLYILLHLLENKSIINWLYLKITLNEQNVKKYFSDVNITKGSW